MTPDSELLRRYARAGSEDAFAELVQRHVNLVYSAALRQVGDDAHLARDAAQNVFIALARKARPLSRRNSLTGWLYTSAHFAAAKIVRAEQRRRGREGQFMREPSNENTPDADWETIRPALDEIMHELKAADREAVLLRYFENRPFAEVGAKLGLSENAARMRVERALEKLRSIFAKRGISTAAALAALLSANAVQTAPAGLGAALATASVSAAGTGAAFTLLKFMTATHVKLGISALVVAGAATAMVMQHQTQTRLRDEGELLRQQIAQLKTDNQSLSNRLAAVGQAKSLTDEQFNELMRLRGEVALLRRQNNELRRLRAENRQLRASLATASQNQQASEANSAAEQEKVFAINEMNNAKQFGLAMRMYADDHQNQFPTNYEEMTNYLGNDPNVLSNMSQFQIVYQGSWTNITNPASAIVAEGQAWQTASGTWAKVYGFADGHVETHISPDGNFETYESQHEVAPPDQNQ
ncbi:MAG: sigma-70 family RNA polymerase sigma factor [Verrucomicrobiota bacterium]|nr:sigma-70 family RNA polymerase sigma factor [Verrucomicrobiota bacterium]